MALTNTQYEAIIRGYEEKQTRNRHIETGRRNTVYARVPGFQELDGSMGSISVSYAARVMDGDQSALSDLHRSLSDLTARKKQLLKEAGLPEDYLEAVYDCPDCQDTGYLTAGASMTDSGPADSGPPDSGPAGFGPAGFAESDYGTRRHGEKCHCFRQQEISILYEQSNIQDMIAKDNFSTLSYEYYQGDDLKRFQSAVRVSENFVENFNSVYHNLFFYGTVGTGKSFLSGCIAGNLLQQSHSVIYFSSSALFDTLARYAFDAKAKSDLYHFHKDLYNADLLIIDDLGTELTNSFVTSGLFACLNERHLRKKATIISTNLNLEELRDRYSERIFSRITSNFQVLKLSGPDIRMYKKRMTNKKS